MPGIAVISTGNELVEPEQSPGPGKIRNSNGIQLAAQVMQYGLTPDYLGIVDDNNQALHKILAEAIKKYQVVLISGGVSVGDYDYVPEVLKQLNGGVISWNACQTRQTPAVWKKGEPLCGGHARKSCFLICSV